MDPFGAWPKKGSMFESHGVLWQKMLPCDCGKRLKTNKSAKSLGEKLNQNKNSKFILSKASFEHPAASADAQEGVTKPSCAPLAHGWPRC